MASLKAMEAAALASDPAVKAALLRIVADEQAHAQLAFEVLRWALGELPSAARKRLAAECEQELSAFEASLGRSGSSEPSRALRAHGVLDGRALNAIRHDAVEQVVRPLISTNAPAEDRLASISTSPTGVTLPTWCHSANGDPSS